MASWEDPVIHYFAICITVKLTMEKINRDANTEL